MYTCGSHVSGNLLNNNIGLIYFLAIIGLNKTHQYLLNFFLKFNIISFTQP